jgi:hypothetical protein
MNTELRERLDSRALDEQCGYAELIRSAVNCYLAELITKDVLSDIDPALLRDLAETTLI